MLHPSLLTWRFRVSQTAAGESGVIFPPDPSWAGRLRRCEMPFQLLYPAKIVLNCGVWPYERMLTLLMLHDIAWSSGSNSAEIEHVTLSKQTSRDYWHFDYSKLAEFNLSKSSCTMSHTRRMLPLTLC